MDLKDILSISGYGGLFKFVSQGRNGVIVEGLEDKKRMNAFTSYKVSSLKDIAVFTDAGEVPLQKVFKLISDSENGGQALSSKPSDDELKEYFAKILPDYKKDKVYVSDIRKMVHWYNILQKNGITNFEEDPAEKPAEEIKEETKAETKEEPREKDTVKSEKPKEKDAVTSEKPKKSKKKK
jgi:hypothetical protein